MNDKWYKAGNTAEVSTPAILVYPERIEANIRKMIEIAGIPERIRPHVKTHKMPEIIKLQLRHGIRKFKCATIAEAEMTASAGAADILLAMQPVGPALGRFFNLRNEYKHVQFSCIADNEHDTDRISLMSAGNGMETHVWLDLNVGMNRTGILPGKEAVSLYKKIISSPMLVADGLHVYDGHIHEHDPGLRKKLAVEAFSPVGKMLEELKQEGLTDIRIVAGGTPTFPIHADYRSAELSPGTGLLWDYGYTESFSDLGFIHAAVLLTRIVSKPAPGLLCLDLGHKAVASEMPHPRVKFPDLGDYEFVGHNEEHMVIKTSQADSFITGDELYAIPWHICPTIDRHDKAVIVRNGLVEEEWNIEARRRKINF
jgi:D-serine deaminase-like pyridoxal phosphate-dependent protein